MENKEEQSRKTDLEITIDEQRRRLKKLGLTEKGLATKGFRLRREENNYQIYKTNSIRKNPIGSLKRGYIELRVL